MVLVRFKKNNCDLGVDKILDAIFRDLYRLPAEKVKNLSFRESFKKKNVFCDFDGNVYVVMKEDCRILRWISEYIPEVDLVFPNAINFVKCG